MMSIVDERRMKGIRQVGLRIQLATRLERKNSNDLNTRPGKRLNSNQVTISVPEPSSSLFHEIVVADSPIPIQGEEPNLSPINSPVLELGPILDSPNVVILDEEEEYNVPEYDAESRFAVRPYDQVLWYVGSRVDLSKNIYVEETTIGWNDLASLVGVLSISFYRATLSSQVELKYASAFTMKTIRELQLLRITNSSPDLAQIIDYSTSLKAILLQNMACSLRRCRIAPDMDFKQLLYLQLNPGQPVVDYYDTFKLPKTNRLQGLMQQLCNLCPNLLGLRMPLPFTQHETIQFVIARLPLPRNLLYLELTSWSSNVFVDLRGLEKRGTLQYLSLIDMFVLPVGGSVYDSAYRMDLSRGPQLCLGGTVDKRTMAIFEHIVKHKPFRFEVGGVVPQYIYTPEYFNKVWQLELDVKILGFPRQEVSEIMQGFHRNNPRFYAADVPDTITAQQRNFIPSPSDKTVIVLKSPAKAESERERLTKFTCKDCKI